MWSVCFASQSQEIWKNISIYQLWYRPPSTSSQISSPLDQFLAFSFHRINACAVLISSSSSSSEFAEFGKVARDEEFGFLRSIHIAHVFFGQSGFVGGSGRCGRERVGTFHSHEVESRIFYKKNEITINLRTMNWISETAPIAAFEYFDWNFAGSSSWPKRFTTAYIVAAYSRYIWVFVIESYRKVIKKKKTGRALADPGSIDELVDSANMCCTLRRFYPQTGRGGKRGSESILSCSSRDFVIWARVVFPSHDANDTHRGKGSDKYQQVTNWWKRRQPTFFFCNQ